MNTLYYGDNLEILRKYIPDESVDLIYLDPPFNSNRAYNQIFKDKEGKYPPSQIKAFDDTWSWSDETEKALDELKKTEYPAQLYRTLKAFETAMGSSDMMAYLVMMGIRLCELKRVLKNTGSIYLHCDPTASHYLKIIMDQIFGVKNYRNEIAWCYHGATSPGMKHFAKKHDIIFWYSKSDSWIFNLEQIRLPYAESTLERANHIIHRGAWTKGEVHLKEGGKFPEDWWEDIKAMQYISPKERLGYPTQKPQALLERIIKASSNEGDIVLDPFCGCGTTIAAAEKLGRKWLGIDITILAINLIEKRIKEHFPDAKYEEIGKPKDFESAKKLTEQSKFLFEQWFVTELGGQPFKSSGGGDMGIDGFMYFKDNDGKDHTIILSVKGGSYNPSMIRDLKGVVERENAAIGLLLALNEPTDGMKKEAATAGLFQMPDTQRTYPKIQIFTVGDFFDNRRPNIPDVSDTLKKAKREIRESEKKTKLL